MSSEVSTTIDHDWIQSEQGAEYLKYLTTSEHQLKDFSILSPLVLPSALMTKRIPFKISIVGQSDAGKTSLLKSLMAKEFSSNESRPTIGIQTKTIYWPVRINQGLKPVVIFQLEFWDVGDISASRFAYVEQSLIESTDLIIFVVSASDRESFNRLGNLIQEKLKQVSSTRPFSSLVFITKVDQYPEISENEARQFQTTFNVPVYFFSSIFSNLRQSTLFLNIISDTVYQRYLETENGLH